MSDKHASVENTVRSVGLRPPSPPGVVNNRPTTVACLWHVLGDRECAVATFVGDMSP